ENDRAALDMTEKASADPDALAGALDEAGQIGEDELLVAEIHDAELRLQRREGVVRDLRPRPRGRGEKRRLAGVGQADETGVGDQLEAQPDPALLAGPAKIEASRCPVRRGLEMGVAVAAVAAAQED